MKKQMILFLALAMALALMTGCGRIAGENNGRQEESSVSSENTVLEEQEEPPASSSEGDAPQDELLWLTIDNTDAYESAYVFAIEEDGLYSFETLYGAEESIERPTWDIYVLEEAFDDGTRYIPQAFEPCLTGEGGSLSLKAGSWVYCFCSLNAFTGDNLPEGSGVLQVYQSVQPVDSGTFSEQTVIVEEEPQSDSTVITSEDAFEGAASFVVENKGMYTFTITNAEGYEDVTWDIYVLEEPFEEAVRYIPQAEVPALSGEGSLALVEGQVVYCFCSVNSFTNAREEVAGASTLSYTIGR